MKRICQAMVMVVALWALPVQAGLVGEQPGRPTPTPPAPGWAAVGEAVASAPAATRRDAAPARLDNRKADMVRRMFWIMLAHR